MIPKTLAPTWEKAEHELGSTARGREALLETLILGHAGNTSAAGAASVVVTVLDEDKGYFSRNDDTIGSATISLLPLAIAATHEDGDAGCW